jgi:hypothetical protein
LIAHILTNSSLPFFLGVGKYNVEFFEETVYPPPSSTTSKRTLLQVTDELDRFD